MRGAAFLALALAGCGVDRSPPPPVDASIRQCTALGLFPGSPEFAACTRDPSSARNKVNDQGLHDLGGMSHS